MNRRRLIAVGVLGIAVLAVNSVLYQVDETEICVVTQFGRPVATIEEAGLRLKLPAPFQTVGRFDRRVLIHDVKPVELLTSDKKNLIVDAYIGWRIADARRFLETVKNREVAEVFLADMVGAEIGAAIGRHPLSALVSVVPEEIMVEELMAEVTGHCREKAERDYGIAIIEVAMKRLNLPDQNKQSVFSRMRTERERMAKKYRSEGEEEALKIRAETEKERRTVLAEAYRRAQEIEGEGEAEAAKIYAEAFEQAPGFYRLSRTLESYRKFLNDRTTVVLSTDSELLELLTGGRPRGE